MRVTFQVGNLTIGGECADQLAAFDFMAETGAALLGEPCGVCGCKDVKPVLFSGSDRKTRKFACQKPECGAGIFVNSKDGRIFLGRKDRDQRPLPNRGWSIYKKDGQPTSQAQDADPRDTPEPGSEVPF